MEHGGTPPIFPTCNQKFKVNSEFKVNLRYMKTYFDLKRKREKGSKKARKKEKEKEKEIKFKKKRHTKSGLQCSSFRRSKM